LIILSAAKVPNNQFGLAFCPRKYPKVFLTLIVSFAIGSVFTGAASPDLCLIVILFSQYISVTFFVIATKKVTKEKSRQTRSLRAFCLATLRYILTL
jgi:hypothetical protein